MSRNHIFKPAGMTPGLKVKVEAELEVEEPVEAEKIVAENVVIKSEPDPEEIKVVFHGKPVVKKKDKKKPSKKSY